MGDTSIQHITQQNCRFPVPIQRCEDIHHQGTVAVTDNQNFIPGSEANFEHLEALLTNAWAILLRRYVRKNSLYFVVLSNGLGVTNNQQTKTPYDVEAIAVYYQIFEDTLLSDICPSVSHRCSKEELDFKQTNTAVAFSLCDQSTEKV